MCYIHCEPNLEHWDHPFERKRGLVIAIYPAIPYDILPGELKQQFNLIPCHLIVHRSICHKICFTQSTHKVQINCYLQQKLYTALFK